MKQEGTASWRRGSRIAIQRRGAEHEGRESTGMGREGSGDKVERQGHRHRGIAKEVAYACSAW